MPTAIPEKLNNVKTVKLAGDLLSVARVPETDRLFVGSWDGKVYDVDLSAENPQPIAMSGHVSYVSAVAVAGKYVVSGGSDHRLIWWDIKTHKQVRSIEGHQKWIRHLAASPDGKTIASVGDDMVCRLWDAESGKLLRELRGHKLLTKHHFTSKLFTCTFSRDGKYLATADHAGHVVVWEFSSGKEIATLEAPAFYEWDATAEIYSDHSYGGVRALAFSPDANMLAVAGILNTDANITNGQALLQVFDWQKGKMTHEFKDGGNFFYENVEFHHQGDWIVAAPGAGKNTNINFFALGKKKLLKKVDGLRTLGMVLNETSDAIYAVGKGQIVKLMIAKPKVA